MNDEIKQLLIQLEYFIEENYKYYNNFELDKNQVKQLLDCITNLEQDNTMYAQLKDEYEEEIKDLQQENERLKELNKNASKVCMAEHRYGVDKAEEARDYKSRCEKAIEYIKEHSTSTYFSMLQADYDMNLDILLNILQNGCENDE